MLRTTLSDALKQAMKAKEACAVSTVRLILAALKDRDISARGHGNQDGIGDDEILQMLQTMVKQRDEAIRMYEQGGRLELAEQERAEIAVIQSFMPAQIEGEALEGAVKAVIGEVGAKDIKDMGRTMAALKQRYPGRMDFAKASAMVRQALV
jgi:uncharacterized protein